MTIGIIGAMDEEIAFISDKMTDKTEKTVANTLFIEGKLNNQDVVLLKSGIGKVNAAMSTTILMEEFSPEYIINTGSAGGIGIGLEVGQIVVSTSVLHHDVDASAFDYTLGQVPGMPERYVANADLINRVDSHLKKLDIAVSKGIIASGDSFINNPKQSQYIKDNFPDVLAIEMEAAAVAQVSYQYEVPFVIIRALSDIAGEESSLSFESFLEKAAKNASSLIFEMI